METKISFQNKFYNFKSIISAKISLIIPFSNFSLLTIASYFNKTVVEHRKRISYDFKNVQETPNHNK